MKKELTRRQFLILSSVAAGEAALVGLAPPAWGMMMGRRGAAGVIDPPAGEAFRDPAELPLRTLAGGIRYGELEAREAQVTVAGRSARLLAYNGQVPGPTVRVRRGERLRLRFRNSLPAHLDRFGNDSQHAASATNLHTHGWHVSPSGKADNVHLYFRPGEEFVYEYDLSLLYPGALCLYHPHIHQHVAVQMWRGLMGALVVEDDTDALSPYETHVMVLKDLSLQGDEPTVHSGHHDFMHGKEGDLVTVNGQSNPVLAVRPGQVQRWRIVNGSNARFYHLALEGHSLYVVGTDGGLLDKMYPQGAILLAPGERVDLLVKAGEAGRYRLRSLPYNRGMGAGLQTVTLLTLACSGKATDDRGPAVINPAARRLAVPEKVLTREISLSMGHGRGYINGHTFAVNPWSVVSRLEGYEVWRIVNASGMDHPFHQHVNAAQVLEIKGGDPAYAALYTGAPAWKDTVTVPKWGSVTLLVPVKDYSGDAMFHCHIIEHEDIGMMAMWYLRGEGEPAPTGGGHAH